MSSGSLIQAEEFTTKDAKNAKGNAQEKRGPGPDLLRVLGVLRGELRPVEHINHRSHPAASFDHQVADKMGEFFARVFLPTMKKLVRAGLPYDAVKGVVGIPSIWGAKISGKQFRERAAEALKGREGN